MDKIDHGNRCLDNDFNIKELSMHMKRTTKMAKKNKQ